MTTKRVVVLLVSISVFVLDFLHRSFLHLIGGSQAGTWIVLQYHGISAEQRSRFAQQMDTLCRIGIPVPADSTAPLSRGLHISVTFDDGLISFVQNALPEIEKRRIPVTLFVAADRLGMVPSWAAHSSQEIPTERMLNGDELKELSAKVLIGSHSSTHAMLPALTESEARREIAGSRNQLEELLGREVTLFSFPYGAFTEKLVTFCREAGYKRAFSILPVLATPDPQVFVCGRVSVEPTDWPLEFFLRASGSYRWLPYAFAAKRTLIRLLVPNADDQSACRDWSPH